MIGNRWQLEVRAIPSGMIDPAFAASQGILLIGSHAEHSARAESIRVINEADRELLEIRVASSCGCESKCLVGADRLILATDGLLADIDMARKKVNWEYSAEACISRLNLLDDGDVIVEYEVGIARLRPDGNVVWVRQTQDLIVDGRRENGTLIVRLDNGVELHVDELTGTAPTHDDR